MMASRGYDMTPTMYSPDGRIYQVEYAIETVKRGTLAIGIRCNEGTIVAVEEKARILQVSDVTHKIFQIDHHIGVAAAGYIPDARIQVDNARFFSQGSRINFDEPVEIESVAKHIADQCHQYTQYSGVRPYGVALIIAGVDQKGPLVFVTDPSGTYVSYAAVAIGAESDQVNDFLEKSYKDDISLDDAAALSIAALSMKTDQNDGIKNIKMARVKRDKKIFERISEKELEKFATIAKQKFKQV